MAYENGRRIHSYSKKKYHKDRQKKYYMQMLRGFGTNDFDTFVYLNTKDSSYPCDDFFGSYWYNYSTQRKKIARNFTHGKARAELVRIKREAMTALDFDDIPSINQSVYEKNFDYAWTVW